MGSMLVGMARGGIDIRNLGSGNAGGTNALRTQGLAFALGVIVIDIGKGVFVTAVIPGLDLPQVGLDPELSRVWLTLACAAGAVAGHVWPMWYGFRGGKGAATLLGTLIVLDASTLLPVMVVWLLTIVLSGYVGLSTIIASAAAPIYVGVTRLPEGEPLFVYCVVMAIYIGLSHRTNIQRMIAGTENRVVGAMLFRPRNKQIDE